MFLLALLFPAFSQWELPFSKTVKLHKYAEARYLEHLSLKLDKFWMSVYYLPLKFSFNTMPAHTKRPVYIFLNEWTNEQMVLFMAVSPMPTQ